MPRITFDLRELESELGEEVADILLEIGNEIINEIKREGGAPRGATNSLVDSWQIFFAQPGVVVLGSDIRYARYVDEGTPPHTPPFEPIQLWARRKLGDESAAWPVWQKIREEGTDPNPYIDEAIEQALSNIQ